MTIKQKQTAKTKLERTVCNKNTSQILKGDKQTKVTAIKNFILF